MFASTASAKQDGVLSKIEDLDKKFQSISIEYFRLKADNAEITGDIDLLVSRVKNLRKQQRNDAAIQLIYTNEQTLKQNSSNPALVDFLKFLLEQNQWMMADQIHQLIIQSADDLNLKLSNLYLAAFYSDHLKWSLALKTLGDNFSQLAEMDAAYANLLQGVALQHLKQHRKAIKSYEKIPATSRYAVYASLNTAIAYIRLGWLSDARKKIKTMVESPDIGSDKETTNRLYLIIGYALLQREYYRDSRTAFRNISLDSRYTSKALLGIALSATNQGDYIGGLNALAKLKQLKSNDLPYDEAYLVAPLLYQKLKQPLSVASTYSEAVDHYTQRLKELEDLKSAKLNPDDLHLDIKTGEITIQKLRLEYSQSYPASFFSNRKLLIKQLKTISQSNLKNKIQHLLNQYNKTSKTILDKLLEQRKRDLSSYLNQARYGLARHYDNEQQGKQQ